MLQSNPECCHFPCFLCHLFQASHPIHPSGVIHCRYSQVLPILKRSSGGSGWHSYLCSSSFFHPFTILQLQKWGLTECPGCNYIQHALLLHPQWLGGKGF